MRFEPSTGDTRTSAGISDDVSGGGAALLLNVSVVPQIEGNARPHRRRSPCATPCCPVATATQAIHIHLNLQICDSQCCSFCIVHELIQSFAVKKKPYSIAVAIVLRVKEIVQYLSVFKSVLDKF